MAQNDSRTREPGLAAALAAGLDPDQHVKCYAANWIEDGQWRTVKFADPDDASAYLLTLSATDRYVVGTSAPRREVYPPMVADQTDTTTVLLRAFDRIGAVIAKMRTAEIEIAGSYDAARTYLADARRCLDSGQLVSALECASLALLEIGG